MSTQLKRPAAAHNEIKRPWKKRAIGSYCAVPGCSNYAGKTKGTDISYHKFPTGPSLQDLWIKKIQRGGVWNPERSYICSTHFKDDDYERDLKAELLHLKKRKILKAGVVPSLNLPEVRGDHDFEDNDSRSGCASLDEDDRTTVPSLNNQSILVFEVGSSENSLDDGESDDSDCQLSTTETEATRTEYSRNGTIVLDEDETEIDFLEAVGASSNEREVISEVTSGRTELIAESLTNTNNFTGCERSERLRAEINKLRIELKGKEDSMFILEQSSALKEKQHLRLIRELKAENERLKTEVKEKNEKISTLEEVLATDTKLRSIFSPDELKRFLKKAKRWSEL